MAAGDDALGVGPCVANDQIGEFGSTGSLSISHLLPPSVERWMPPAQPTAPSPLATKSVFGSSIFCVSARQ